MNVSPGDLATVIESIDSLSVGMVVQVVSLQGHHTKFGPIWRCRSRDEITTEYGGKGNEADFADSWLKKIEPGENTDQNTKVVDKHVNA